MDAARGVSLVPFRASALRRRVYFSRLVPRRLRDWHLDRAIGRARLGELAHADPPVTFTDKIRYKMLHDRRRLLVQWADKVAAREYVAARVGEDLLPKLYLVTGDATSVRSDTLPREFVLKPSHGCGAGVVVGDHVPSERELPRPPVGWQRFEVSPRSLDWGRLGQICSEWLALRFRPRVEWVYRNVPPRILAEELLLEDGGVARDYKCFVLNGRVRMVEVITGRFGETTASPYSPEWQRIQMRFATPSGPDVERPPKLAEMIRIAEALGEETDFVRVDLYAPGDRIVVGELTSYHAGGLDPLRPASFDRELGALWALPEAYV